MSSPACLAHTGASSAAAAARLHKLAALSSASRCQCLYFCTSKASKLSTCYQRLLGMLFGADFLYERRRQALQQHLLRQYLYFYTRQANTLSTFKPGRIGTVSAAAAADAAAAAAAAGSCTPVAFAASSSSRAVSNAYIDMCMYVYTYVCMYVSLSIYIYIHVYIYVYIYLYIDI